MPWDNAKIEGPEPEILQPRAPAFLDRFFASSKPGIRIPRIGSAITSFKEKEVKSPMLYVMGSEDYMFLPPVKSIVEKHKNSTLKVIENCGHVCNVERPGAFNRISIAYLKSQV